MPSRVVVAIAQRTCSGGKPFVWIQSLELTHSVADIQLVVNLGSLDPLRGAILVLVFEITIKEHSLAAAIAKITV